MIIVSSTGLTSLDSLKFAAPLNAHARAKLCQFNTGPFVIIGARCRYNEMQISCTIRTLGKLRRRASELAESELAGYFAGCWLLAVRDGGLDGALFLFYPSSASVVLMRQQCDIRPCNCGKTNPLSVLHSR